MRHADKLFRADIAAAAALGVADGNFVVVGAAMWSSTSLAFVLQLLLLSLAASVASTATIVHGPKEVYWLQLVVRSVLSM